jgi:Flp pilus assembly pilin Flp
MFTSFRAILRDRRAIAALEYALIAGVIFSALILSGKIYGPQLSSSFTNLGVSILARDSGT